MLRKTHAHTQHSTAPARLTVILMYRVSARQDARITHTMPCSVWGLLRSLWGCKCNFPDRSSWYIPVTLKKLSGTIDLNTMGSFRSQAHPLVVWGWPHGGCKRHMTGHGLSLQQWGRQLTINQTSLNHSCTSAHMHTHTFRNVCYPMQWIEPQWLEQKTWWTQEDQTYGLHKDKASGSISPHSPSIPITSSQPHRTKCSSPPN
jgi:hypothetical protein